MFFNYKLLYLIPILFGILPIIVISIVFTLAIVAFVLNGCYYGWTEEFLKTGKRSGQGPVFFNGWLAKFVGNYNGGGLFVIFDKKSGQMINNCLRKH